MTGNAAKQVRDVVFISKGTPDDDDFVLWLAPKLEAQGYKVFADILSLEPGDRWRREITSTLQARAAKMLLCCRDITLAKTGVQEEIGIALDLVKELGDPRFIIPLRLEKFRKLFGIGELQYLNFAGRWAGGLSDLLDALSKQGVPRDPAGVAINPNWENYRKRNAIALERTPERLTSNWLRIAELPEVIRYFQPTGAIDHQAFHQECADSRYPAELYLRGVFSFCNLAEINSDLSRIGRFSQIAELTLMDFVENGAASPAIRGREASNIVMSMLRRAWESYCRDRRLHTYFYSKLPGFHATEDLVPLGKRLRWGRQGENRSSMLRNKAQGRIWQFGVTALPAFWPFPHFKLKSRVLFAEADGEAAGAAIDDKDLQHQLRRRVCKGWRNKQWHGRLMAFLELLSGDEAFLKLPMAANAFVKLNAAPMLFTSPVTTVLPNDIDDADDDEDTLSIAPPDEEDD
ncbi:MAG: toll/interleukin-1 receptor domain-containing protein [Rhodospirillales bacterium]|nr:toll/interleukin-1 receptor domain-containing protein [Rhodospirillales bacterium]